MKNREKILIKEFNQLKSNIETGKTNSEFDNNDYYFAFGLLNGKHIPDLDKLPVEELDKIINKIFGNELKEMSQKRKKNIVRNIRRGMKLSRIAYPSENAYVRDNRTAALLIFLLVISAIALILGVLEIFGVNKNNNILIFLTLITNVVNLIFSAASTFGIDIKSRKLYKSTTIVEYLGIFTSVITIIYIYILL